MGTRRPDDDIPLPPPPTDILSKSTNILTDSGSHRPISGSALQGRLPFVTMAINALSEHLDSDAGANPAAASGQLSRWRAPRPTDNRISAIPGAASRGFQAIKERRDTNRFDIELDARSRAGQSPDANSTQSASVHPISNSSNISVSKESRAAQREGVTNPGPILSAGFVQLISKLQYSPVSQGSEETKERKESPFIQVDSPRERTVIRPYSEQVDRTASVRPSAKPSIPSPPLKRQSVSTSPLSSPPATSLTSSRMLTLRCTLPYEPQAPSRGTPFESPHPGEDRGKARPDEQGHNPSAIPPEHTPATTDPPTLPQPVSGPRRSDRTNSPIQANEGVDRGGEQAMVAPPSERNERKRVMVPEEHENRLKDSANAEPNSTTGYAADVLHYIKASPDMSDSRGEVGQSSNSTLSLDRGESRITPSASVPTQNHPGGVIGLRSINNTNSTVSSTDPCPRPQSLPGDSQALATVTSSTLNAPSTMENGRKSQAQPGLFPPESQHSSEQPAATGMSFFQYHPQSSTRRHSLSPGGDMKQRAFSDSQERSSTPSTRTSSEAHDVSVQPAPLEINHPLAPENRQGEGLRIHPDSLDDLHPEDEFLEGPLHAPMRRGPPLENGPPPPGIRAQSPEKSASFWCCC